MIYTFFNLINVLTIIAFIAFLNFLYKKIKKESGKWTAFLVFLIVIMNFSFPYEPFENDEEFTVYSSQCQDCELKANYRIEIDHKIGLINRMKTYHEVYKSEENDEDIYLLKKKTSFYGLMAAIEFGSSQINLKRIDGNKVYYKETILSRSNLFLFLTWSDGFDIEREVELIPI